MERNKLRNLMYELYKKDYSKFTKILWEYDYFFDNFPDIEYYQRRANIILRKDKIKNIKINFYN
jgi:RecA-family ATPase